MVILIVENENCDLHHNSASFNDRIASKLTVHEAS